MQVIVNGERREMVHGMTVDQLLENLSLDDRRLAVELNRRLVPREEHARTSLTDGDQLEIVTLVGGG